MSSVGDLVIPDVKFIMKFHKSRKHLAWAAVAHLIPIIMIKGCLVNKVGGDVIASHFI